MQRISAKRTSRLGKILAFIDRNLHDRALCAARIVESCEISRTSLYRLFEAHGGVNAAIINRRLEQAARVILTAPGRHDDPAWIVKRHGFATRSHFSRIFKTRFGVPPGQYCTLVRGGDRAWIDEQRSGLGLARWRDTMRRAPPPPGGSDKACTLPTIVISMFDDTTPVSHQRISPPHPAFHSLAGVDENAPVVCAE